MTIIPATPPTTAAVHKKPISIPFYFGGVASCMAACCTHPLDTLKVRMQADPVRRGSIGTFNLVVKNEGFLALYKGLSASMLRQITYSTVRFGAYEYFKELSGATDEKPLSFASKVGLAMAAGGLGGICGNPADVTNIRMQADGRLPAAERRGYKNAFDGLFRITKEEGILTLWKGWGPNVNRAMFMTASQIATYDQCKEIMLASGYFKDNVITHVISSLIAGLVATTVCSPFDVIKTRMMNSKKGEYASTWDCTKKMFQKEGALAFFKGWTPSYTRLMPQTLLTFVFLEQLKEFYRKLFA